MNRKGIASGVLAVGIAGLLSTEASALECGDTVEPGQRVQLEADVGPCTAETGGITIEGPATLDLNGFAITCLVGSDLAQNPTGILVVGERANVKDGRVLACGIGVEIEGSGRHRIQSVEAALSGRDGFLVLSHRNVLKKNVASHNQRNGYWVFSERNVLKKNRASENDEFGFRVAGDAHRVIRNEAYHDAWGAFFAETYSDDGPSKYIRNVARSPDGEYDIVGAANACSNLWKRNEFTSASLSCIQ